jgi:hypothetical protein
MKWVKSEVAPRTTSLLQNDKGVFIGMVEFEKYTHVYKWKALVMPSYNTIGRRQTKREAMKLVEDHYEMKEQT